MQVLLIQGSLGRPSRTAAMVSMVAELLKRQGTGTHIWDLRASPLPMADPAYHARPEDHPDPRVKELVAQATAADGFVLASPVYHNSYSGALKNCLDHLAIPMFEGKPIALCGNGGRRGSVQPCDHLRIVARGLHGVAIPYQVVSMNSDYREVNGEYKITSEELVRRLVLMTNQMAEFLRLFSGARRLPGQSSQ